MLDYLGGATKWEHHSSWKSLRGYSKTTIAATATSEDHTSEIVSSSNKEGDEGNSPSPTSDTPLFRNSPLHEIRLFYISEHKYKKSIAGECMKTWSIFIKKKKSSTIRWSAEFTCPISSRVFPAGQRFRTGEDDDPSCRSEIHVVPAKDLDSVVEISDDDGDEGSSTVRVVTYPTKALAQQAAASLALDVFRYESTGVMTPRLCEEDPSTFLAAINPWLSTVVVTKDDETTTAAATEDVDNENEDAQSISNKPISATKTLEEHEVHPRTGYWSNATRTKVVSSVNIESDQQGKTATKLGDETQLVSVDDDELVVYNPSKGVSRDDRRSPALRLLDSIALTTMSKPAVSTTIQETSNPLVEVARTVRMAQNWVNSIHVDKSRTGNREASDHTSSLVIPRQMGNQISDEGRGSTATLKLAKSVLSILAEANQSVPPTTRTLGIQNVAKKILNLLWDQEDGKPDVEVYNLYLCCLEGPDLLSTAMRAEKIVESMKKQRHVLGEVPPKPNIDSFNSLLQIWARMGGTRGRYNGLEDDFEPNRESFLAILSSSSYEPAHTDSPDEHCFDREFAITCIERMQELYEETSDESFKPDVTVYNAPLRWSGGSSWKETRPNTRAIAWDDHMKIFKNGFCKLDQSDPLVKNAKAVEAWMAEMMGVDGVEPNIETYEAVIQAWVRTGTREGLERADALAKELCQLDSPLEVRKQTLHPILAGWLFAKDAHSSSHILEWVETLQALEGEGRFELDRDLRFLCLEIAAHYLRCCSRGTSEDYEKTDAMQSARKCMDLLEDFVNGIKVGSIETNAVLKQMLITPFTLTLSAWKAQVSSGNSSSNEEGLRGTLRAIDLFEDAMLEVAQKESLAPNEKLSVPEGNMRLEQLRDLVNLAHYPYNHAVAVMRDMAKKTKADNHDPALLVVLPNVERMTRRIGEFQEIENHYIVREGSRRVSESKLSFLDQYEYDFGTFGSQRRSQRRSTYPFLALELLRELAFSKDHVTPLVRISLLLKSFGNGWNFKTSNLNDAVDDVLEQVIPGLQDRGDFSAFLQQDEYVDSDPSPFSNKKINRAASSKSVYQQRQKGRRKIRRNSSIQG